MEGRNRKDRGNTSISSTESNKVVLQLLTLLYPSISLNIFLRHKRLYHLYDCYFKLLVSDQKTMRVAIEYAVPSTFSRWRGRRHSSFHIKVCTFVDQFIIYLLSKKTPERNCRKSTVNSVYRQLKLPVRKYHYIFIIDCRWDTVRKVVRTGRNVKEVSKYVCV